MDSAHGKLEEHEGVRFLRSNLFLTDNDLLYWNLIVHWGGGTLPPNPQTSPPQLWISPPVMDSAHGKLEEHEGVRFLRSNLFLTDNDLLYWNLIVHRGGGTLPPNPQTSPPVMDLPPPPVMDSAHGKLEEHEGVKFLRSNLFLTDNDLLYWNLIVHRGGGTLPPNPQTSPPPPPQKPRWTILSTILTRIKKRD